MPSRSPSDTSIPRFSQHLDIREVAWQSKACGVVVAAMLLTHLGKKTTPEKLLREALLAGAYLPGTGWIHRPLARLAESRGLYGKNYDWFTEPNAIAFKRLVRLVMRHPVIVSVHKGFHPKSGGHLVLVTAVTGNTVSYLEPDSRQRSRVARTVPTSVFIHGWKRRVIVMRPKQAKRMPSKSPAARRVGAVLPQKTKTHKGLFSARWTGLEPATSAVTGQRSNQLSYHRKRVAIVPTESKELQLP